jgi:PKD repeat protein
MKTMGKWVLVISLLAMVSWVIAPVSADWQTPVDMMGNIYVGEVFPIQTPADLCANAGQVGPETGYENFYQVTFHLVSHAPWPDWSDNGEAELYNNMTTPPTNSQITIPNGYNTSMVYQRALCNQTHGYMVYQIWNISGSTPPPNAAFSCTPTTQGIDSSIVCIDSSTNVPTSWYWVIDDETRDVHPLQTSTTHGYTWQSHYPGLYSVSLQVVNGAGSDWENKTNYVNITSEPIPTPTPTPGPTVAPGYVRSTFITKSATTWNTIHGSNIMLYDTYSHTWKNSTSDADGILYIDTLPYTTINAYATFTIFANEYADASVVANADVNGGTFIILMYPISSPPPAGSVNLFVSTMDGNNNVLRDVTVTAVWDGYPHTGSSGAYGTAQWVVPNNTQVRLTGSKVGYDGAEEIIDTGIGPSYSVILYLDQQHITPTPTSTPGVTVPTTIGPYGTPGPSGTMASGYTNTQGQKMLDFLATNGMGLVELCFMVTILALLGVKLGK